MKIKKIFKKIFPKTKEQKHLEKLKLEIERGKILHIDDGIKNGK